MDWTPEDELIMRQQQAACQSKGKAPQTKEPTVASGQAFEEDGRLRWDMERPVGKSTLGHEWMDFRDRASRQSLDNALTRRDLSPNEQSLEWKTSLCRGISDRTTDLSEILAAWVMHPVRTQRTLRGG